MSQFEIDQSVERGPHSVPQEHQPKVIMSGMRPTGSLHLGHYYGVLSNWLKLQDQYECYFMIADWHALTTQYDRTEQLQTHIKEVLLDWLATGIDPDKATVYVQSSIPEIAELHLLLSMLTPLPWVQGDPTLKDMVKMLHEDLNYGLLGYPVLQTTDILVMGADSVPVGKDQLAHLEISRDIARRFNHVYQTNLFPEPQALLTETPLMLGVDGNKMGKSNHNAVYLKDSDDETLAKIKTAITDPARVKKADPGSPEACVAVYPLYSFFTSADVQTVVAEECRAASRGCMDCKKQLAEAINETLRPLRQRRAEWVNNPEQLTRILKQGHDKAREQAQKTMQQVRSLVKLV